MAFKKSDVFDVSDLKADLDGIKHEEIDKNLNKIIEKLKNKNSKVITFTGAGVSTSAGIPDFRSKDGLYNIVKSKLNISNPECIFDLEYFKSDPKPFYCVASKFIEEEYKPTLAHCFIKLLFDKGLLLKNFTQNVDGLDSKAGLPSDLNIECHGHFRSGGCLSCDRRYTYDEMRIELEGNDLIKCDVCSGVVKPDIIMFGEGIPMAVFSSLPKIPSADIIIVMGTSLTVMPFNQFISMANKEAMCLVINRELPGTLLFANDDNIVLLETDCDSGARKLCALLDWEAELDELYKKCH